MTSLRRFADSFRARLFVGYVLIAAVFALAWIWSLYAPITRTALALVAAALVAAVVIAWWAAAAASRPLVQLSEVAKRMAAGNLLVQVPEVRGEMQVLAGALTTLRNQMRARIDALESEQRTLRTALDGLADAVFLIEGRTVQYANGAAGRMFRSPVNGWRSASIDGASLPAPLSAAIGEGLGGPSRV